jgi:hypothetical protein
MEKKKQPTTTLRILWLHRFDATERYQTPSPAAYPHNVCAAGAPLAQTNSCYLLTFSLVNLVRAFTAYLFTIHNTLLISFTTAPCEFLMVGPEVSVGIRAGSMWKWVLK